MNPEDLLIQRHQVEFLLTIRIARMILTEPGCRQDYDHLNSKVDNYVQYNVISNLDDIPQVLHHHSSRILV